MLSMSVDVLCIIKNSITKIICLAFFLSRVLTSNMTLQAKELAVLHSNENNR